VRTRHSRSYVRFINGGFLLGGFTRALAFRYLGRVEVGEPERAVTITTDDRGRPKRPRRRPETGSEPVIAICYNPSRGLYLVCKPTRGALRGISILVGQSQVRDVEDFT
jgi:hypothetical protein